MSCTVSVCTGFAPGKLRLSAVPLMVAVNNDVPAKTLKELVDLAKAKPGQVSFAYASTSQQVSSEMLSSMAGIQMNAIPYKSGPAAMTGSYFYEKTPAQILQDLTKIRQQATVFLFKISPIFFICYSINHFLW